MIREIEAKSVLRKHKKVDSWFVSHYGMNLYRGCSHNCAYCDGRAEGYYVEGEFGKDIEVKINAPEILNKELNPARKRKPMKKGFVILGGGVNDTYQVINNKYQLSRKALDLIYHYDFPVHVLTKSTFVENDLDILLKINEKKRAIVSFSFSTVDDAIGKIFEPGVPAPSERLNTIRKLKQHGISCGAFLMPVIPFVSDTQEMLHKSISQLKEVGVDFIIFGGMTLKPGRQRDYYYEVLNKHYPKYVRNYEEIYGDNKWGQGHWEYYKSLNELFGEIVRKENIPARIPARLFNDILDKTDQVIVILEQIDYFLKHKWKKNPYGYAAYSVSQLKEPIENCRNNLTGISGVGDVTQNIIKEIIDTGTSSYYEKLLHYKA